MYTKELTKEIFDTEKVSVGDVIELNGVGIESRIIVRGLVTNVYSEKLTFIDLEELCSPSRMCVEERLLSSQAERRNLKVISKRSKTDKARFYKEMKK